MLEKIIKVDGKDVKFRSSATVPRLYRIKFGRDIFKDLAKLEKAYKGKEEDGDDQRTLMLVQADIFPRTREIKNKLTCSPRTDEPWICS